MTFDELKSLLEKAGRDVKVADLDEMGEFVVQAVRERRYIIGRDLNDTIDLLHRRADAISEFSLSQIFFAEGQPSVLRGRGPPSGIFVALIDDARRRFSLSNRAEASARLFELRSWGVSGPCEVGGVQKETRSFVRIANAGFVADADLMRSRRSAASALGGLGGVVGMVALSFAAAASFRTVRRCQRRARRS